MIIIDDPQSDDQRDPKAAAEWWDRCVGNAKLVTPSIIIHSRIHENDLLGAITEIAPDLYSQLVLRP
jgi:hypothetical protein